MGVSSRINANTHFHQHVSILGKRALSFEYYSVSRPISTNTPNEHIQVLRAEQFLFIGVELLRSSKYTSTMERIQYRALKFIYNYFNTSYEELLAVPTYQP